MALAPIDWTNAVIIPLILLFTVGIALSIWISASVSRHIAFNQEIQRAREIVFACVDLFHGVATTMNNEYEAGAKLSWLLLPPASALVQNLDQAAAGEALGALSQRLRESLLLEWKACKEADMIQSAAGTFAAYDRVRGIVEQANKDIGVIRPDLWQIYSMPTFGRIVGRIRGSGRHKKC